MFVGTDVVLVRSCETWVPKGNPPARLSGHQLSDHRLSDHRLSDHRLSDHRTWNFNLNTIWCNPYKQRFSQHVRYMYIEEVMFIEPAIQNRNFIKLKLIHNARVYSI